MILIDENLSYKLAARIHSDFEGSIAVSKAPELGEGAPDQRVWDYAKDHGLALLTKDKDFVDYWSRFGPPPKVIRIEIGNARLSAIEALIRNNKTIIHNFLLEKNSGLLLLRG